MIKNQAKNGRYAGYQEARNTPAATVANGSVIGDTGRTQQH